MKEKQFIKEHIREFLEFRDNNYIQQQHGGYVRPADSDGIYIIYSEVEIIYEYLKTIA